MSPRPLERPAGRERATSSNERNGPPRFYLIAVSGGVAGVVERATLRRGDVLVLEDTDGYWRVLATLGQVARVERIPRRTDISASCA